MKMINKKIASGMVVAILMIFTSCTKLTDGISTDPVNVTDPNNIGVSQYLSGIEVSLIGVFEGDAARLSGMWAGYFSGEDRQYAGLANYVTSGADYDLEWATIYASVMKNAQLLKQNAQPRNYYASIGITQVMQAMSMGLAADLWGDVPYTEAIQYPKNAAPKFDTQASVYAAAQVLLDSAIMNLGKGGPTAGDFFYNGNINAWKAAAHTVKARLYLHIRDYANALLESNAGISTPDGNMMAPHGNAYLQTFNMYYSFLTYDRSAYMAANSFAPRLLDPSSATYRGNIKTVENGRFNFYYAPVTYWGGLNTGADYDPNVFCSSGEDGTVNWPKLYGMPDDVTRDGFFSATMSFPILTFQENALIKAEANAKSGNLQPAIDALNSVRAYYRLGSFFGTSTAYINDPDLGGIKYDDYILADFAPSGIENTDNVAQDKAILREILEERYITLIGQIEGYNDMRRTDNFLKIPVAAGKSDFPRRFLYSQVEINTNPKTPSGDQVGLYVPVASFATAY
ncbi:hypothetical protein WSM22_21260 [Cytophagales bacterium WSM2-2]|nr:hypothetical protein WSM22_21260 [Cytophagales bacterium WSM2-2]